MTIASKIFAGNALDPVSLNRLGDSSGHGNPDSQAIGTALGKNDDKLPVLKLFPHLCQGNEFVPLSYSVSLLECVNAQPVCSPLSFLSVGAGMCAAPCASGHSQSGLCRQSFSSFCPATIDHPPTGFRGHSF